GSLESGARHRGRPCPRTPASCSLRISRLPGRRARSETLRCPPWPPLFHGLDDFLQLARHLGNRGARQLHSAVAPLAEHDIHLSERGVLLGIVLPEVAAAALTPLDCGASDRLGHKQQVWEIERGMPAGIVFAMAADADAARPVG